MCILGCEARGDVLRHSFGGHSSRRGLPQQVLLLAGWQVAEVFSDMDGCV
jgi:hypothetical protein